MSNCIAKEIQLQGGDGKDKIKLLCQLNYDKDEDLLHPLRRGRPVQA